MREPSVAPAAASGPPGPHERILYAAHERYAQLLRRMDQLMAAPEFEVVKDLPRVRAGFVTETGERLFVKRLVPQSRLEGWLEALTGSRAARSLAATTLLERGHLDYPKPLAALECRGSFGVVECSYLLSEAIEGEADTFSRFLDRARGGRRLDPRWRKWVLRRVAREVRHLHDCGLYTSDLQETNLIVREGREGLEVLFIDLDRFRCLDAVSWRRRRANLVQLDRSVGRFLTRSERLTFLLAYCGVPSVRSELDRLIVRLLSDRRRKDRQIERRRTRRRRRSSRQASA